MDSTPPSTPPPSTSPPERRHTGASPVHSNDHQGDSGKRIRSTETETQLPAKKKIRESPQAVQNAVFSIEDDTDRQRVLAHYRRQSPKARVIMLSDPRDLDENDLTQTVTCTEKGRLNLSGGRLFSGEPITLVLDLTTMTPGQIASLNDVLDTLPSVNGQPLSAEVRRVVLTTPTMLQPGYSKPGPDCWRRLQRLAPLSQACSLVEGAFQSTVREPVLSNQALLEQRVTPYAPPEMMDTSEGSAAPLTEMPSLSLQPGSITLDFTTTHWRTLLLGGLVLDDQGKPLFRSGQLANLSGKTSLILQDAPWGNASFCQTLATILREKCFYANGQQVTLLEDIRLFRKKTSEEALLTLKQSFLTGGGSKRERRKSRDTAAFVCLNAHSLETALGDSQIKAGTPCSVDTLSELLRDCREIRITGPLTNQQWLRLLRRAEQLRPKPDIVTVDDAAWDETSWQPTDQVRCQVGAHASIAQKAFEHHTVYRFSARDEWESLWYDTALSSQNNFQFEQRETELLKALKSGMPLVLHSMESNPALVSRLESLLACPAYLFVHGQKILLPKANVTFIWPAASSAQQKTQPTASGLWQKALQQAASQSPAQPQQEQLISLLKALPQSTSKTYPDTIPWEAVDFPALLNRQVELEKQQEGASEVLPVHHRKALHTLLVKSYRGDKNVYGYLKTQIQRLYPDKPPEAKADRKALQRWLQDHPAPDRDALKQHFWSLARHCPAQAFGNHLTTTYEPPATTHIDVLARYLVGCTTEDRQPELARQLNVNMSKCKTCHYYDDAVRSRLRDALLMAGDQRTGQECISEQVKRIEGTITNIITRNNHDNAITKVTYTLKGVLPNTLLEGDFKDLPAALVTGSSGSKRRQERRVKRLAARVRQHPLVFLQGVAGAGKSHMARAVAGELKKNADWKTMPDPVVLSLGPETTPENLYGQQVLQEGMDGDQSTRFVPGPLLQWAMNKNPPVLILDEANMAREGLLAPLADLTRSPPQLCFKGEIYPLTDRHRVILTGNPESYDGRHMDSAIKPRMLTLYYRPLSPETLAELIVQPVLPRGWSPALKAHTTRAILSLYSHYQRLFSNELSPRDLQDVLARMKQTLRHANRTDITEQQASALVWQGFTDSLAEAIPQSRRPDITALEHWYQGHFNPEPARESTISAPVQLAFQTFLATLRQKNTDIDLNSEPVVTLVRHYWLFLDKQQDALQGRRGLIVEGPAGWGKDLILQRVLALWQTEHAAAGAAHPVHINANASQWNRQVSLIKAAMAQGQKLVISELNLLPSQYLEGLFNEVLTGNAHPGFVLFATINPSSFGGREALSPALKNRCTQVRLDSLGKDDLNGILQRRYPGHPKMNEWLAQRYHVLSDQLVKSRAPVQLSLDDLFRGADALQGKQPGEWPDIFSALYGLPLQSLRLPPEKLDNAQETQPEPMDDGRNQRQQALSLWINQTSDQPVRVQLLKAGTQPVFNGAEHRLTLPDNTDLKVLQEVAFYACKGERAKAKGQVVPGSFGGDITKPVHHDIRKFFAGKEYYTNHYRLELTKLVMKDDQLQEVLIPCDARGADPLPLPGWPEGIGQLKEGQQLGSGQFLLEKNRWLPLPGLSARDQLIHLHCRENQPLVLARGRDSGQLLVKLADSATCGTFVATLDFIIEPDQQGLKELTPGEKIEARDGLCDPEIRQCLDKQVFSPEAAVHKACYELQTIRAKPDLCQQLLALAKWCREFDDSRDIPGQGLDLLINLIREKQGVCRHRSQVFQVLSEYLGVPARMIANDAHRYVEISPDGGKQWRRLDLGGGGQATWTEKSSNWPAGLSPAFPQERISGETDEEEVMSSLIAQYLPGPDAEKIWQELLTFMSSEYLSRQHIYYNVLESHRFESLLEQGFELDQALPELFLCWQKQIEKTQGQPLFTNNRLNLEKGILSFLLKIQDLWEAGQLSDARYNSVASRCLWLFQQGTLSAGGLLPLLEYLAQQPRCREQAETLLEDFYRQLTQPRQWEALFKEPCQTTIKDLKGHSQTLLAALNQTTVDTRWSRISESHPPDIKRMAQKQPSFPVTHESQKPRPVFFNFPLAQTKVSKMLADTFWTFVDDPSEQGRIPTIKTVAQAIKDGRYKVIADPWESIVPFLYWLFKQDTHQKWHVLVHEHAKYIEDRKCKDSFLPGCYPQILQITQKCIVRQNNFSSKNANAYTETRNPALNPERVKKAFGEPSALVITPDLLCTAYREYLQTMDWSLLLKDEHRR